LYSEDLSPAEKAKIISALGSALDATGFRSAQHWGALIEDRGSQITLSALGQEAPLEEKKKWDPDFKKREKIKAVLAPLLADFSVQLGGATSIDITRPGVDKAYGVQKLRETLGVRIEDMIFIGDALFPGGNDYPVKRTGVVTIQVRDPDETKRVIEAIIACLEGG
jgi:HAD superfamily hydrolase (TIGR01484 family)